MKRFSILAAIVALSMGSFAFGANLLTDPGFESNPLTSYVNVLGNFPLYAGQWGDENSTIVGVDGAITPYQGSLQLKMDPAGTGVTTQTFQVVDISSYAAAIDSNSAYITASAYYNSDAPAAVAGIYVSYFTGNTYGTLTTSDSSVITLDGNTSTWELNSMTKPIPALTRWVLFQVAYDNNSLTTGLASGLPSNYGYVDAASMDITTKSTPTPTAAMGGIALLGFGGMSRTRRAKI